MASRESIDASFAEMKDDAQYQRESLGMAMDELVYFDRNDPFGGYFHVLNGQSVRISKQEAEIISIRLSKSLAKHGPETFDDPASNPFNLCN